jgi:hypothetical protein
LDAQNFKRSPPEEPDAIDQSAGDDSIALGTSFSRSLSLTGSSGQDGIYFYLPMHGSFVLDARRLLST